jgi:hypothetical protein
MQRQLGVRLRTAPRGFVGIRPAAAERQAHRATLALGSTSTVGDRAPG